MANDNQHHPFLTIKGQKSQTMLGLTDAYQGDIYALEVVEIGEEIKLNFIKLTEV